MSGPNIGVPPAVHVMRTVAIVLAGMAVVYVFIFLAASVG